ncbi:MAG: Thoeris anti-defense Tad2 family protein [Rhizobiaceae bacterium]
MNYAEAITEIMAGKTMARPRKFRTPEAHFLNKSDNRDHAGILKRDGLGNITTFVPDLADIQATDWHEFVPIREDDTTAYEEARTARALGGIEKPLKMKVRQP